MKLLIQIIALLPLTVIPALAQVTLTPNAPPTSGFYTLPGGYHQINVIVGGGTTNRVNISVAAPNSLHCWPESTQTDATNCTDALPIVGVRAGPDTGTASWNNTTSPATVSYTASFPVHFQSVDDTTKSVDAVFGIAGGTLATEVHALPLYNQLYADQKETVRCMVHNNADYRCSFAVSGTGCLISKTTELAAEISHTGAAGSCYVTMTSKGDTSKSAVSQIGFVATSAPMAVSPEMTQLYPCQEDPDWSYATNVQVGPTHTYHDLTLTPASADSQFVQVFNEDTSSVVANATRYHNNYLIAGSHVRMCGVPNAAGILPLIDGGTDATSPPWQEAPGGRGSGQYSTLAVNIKGGAQHDVIISGLHVANTQGGQTYIAPDGSTATRDTEGHPGGIRFQTSWGFVAAGNDIDNNQLGITTQDNGGFGYTDITQDGFIEHNYFHGNGLTSIDHQLYVETSGAAVQYNLFGTPRASSGGFQIKPRSSDLIIDGNVIWDFGSGNGQRCVDYVEFQGEGAAPYYSPATWVGQGFNTVGTQTPSIDKIISNNDRAERARIQGNFCKTDGLFPYHFSADHAFDGDNNPGGRLFFQYNTQAQGAFGILQQASPAGDYAVNPYYQPEVHLKNNILLTNRPSSDPAFAMAAQVRDVYYYGPDLYVANTVVLPPTPGTGSPRGDWNGWGSFVASYASNYELPIIDHVSGATSANMIFTASQTIDPNTFTLPEAANKAATLTGEEAYDLPRYWMNPNTGVLTARTAYTDLGAVQRGGNVRHP